MTDVARAKAAADERICIVTMRLGYADSLRGLAQEFTGLTLEETTQETVVAMIGTVREYQLRRLADEDTWDSRLASRILLDMTSVHRALCAAARSEGSIAPRHLRSPRGVNGRNVLARFVCDAEEPAESSVPGILRSYVAGGEARLAAQDAKTERRARYLGDLLHTGSASDDKQQVVAVVVDAHKSLAGGEDDTSKAPASSCAPSSSSAAAVADEAEHMRRRLQSRP